MVGTARYDVKSLFGELCNHRTKGIVQITYDGFTRTGHGYLLYQSHHMGRDHELMKGSRGVIAVVVDAADV